MPIAIGPYEPLSHEAFSQLAQHKKNPALAGLLDALEQQEGLRITVEK